MKPFLRQQLERYPVRLQELDFFLQQPGIVDDMERYRALTREHAEVSEIAGLYTSYLQREKDLAVRLIGAASTRLGGEWSQQSMADRLLAIYRDLLG